LTRIRAMKLSTLVPIKPLSPPLDYESKILFLGSCFAENIGNKVQYYGFESSLNPFGIIFNPASLDILIEKSVANTPFVAEDVEAHYSFYAHSSLNGNDRAETLHNLNNALARLRNSILESSHIFITLGTAWVYEHRETKMIVTNCHKQPQALFEKKLLEPSQIDAHVNAIKKNIHKLNPAAQICYTLSPVRHLKDGFIENTRSKSRLHDAIQGTLEPAVQYFPAYEIVMDELRDYRFYGSDMIHLNETGVDYVWNCFRESGIRSDLFPVLQKVDKFRKLEAHRPQDQEKHNEQVRLQKNKLMELYPFLKI